MVGKYQAFSHLFYFCTVRLERIRMAPDTPGMNFILAALAYIIMGLVLAAGILLMVKGSPWLLILGFLGYVALFSKYGCLHH